MAEAFGRAITKAYKNKDIKGVTITRNMPNITHQQYVDDTTLPRESLEKEAINYKSIIDGYMKASGKKVKEAKSIIFFSQYKGKDGK